jgi:hypothetical protein
MDLSAVHQEMISDPQRILMRGVNGARTLLLTR